MTISTAPMASGATATFPSTVAQTVNTRKKVPTNSVRYLRILPPPARDPDGTGPAAVSGLNGQTVSGDHGAEVDLHRCADGVSRPYGRPWARTRQRRCQEAATS